MQETIIALSIIEFLLIVFLLFRKKADKNSDEITQSDSKNLSIEKENILQQKETACAEKTNKINQLVQEIEDLEDEIASQKKKFKKENDDLNEKIGKCKEIIKQKSEELAEQCSLNAKQNNSITLKRGALGLVSQLLQAKAQQSSETAEQYIKNVDSLADFIIEEFKAFFDEKGSQEFKDSDNWNFLFKDGFSEWKQAAKKQWLDNKTAIAFVGEFSAGKTSIVNKILSMNNPANALQLPVSTKATTAVPTYISRGAGDSYSFYTPDNQLKSLTKTAFEMVSKEVLDELSGISNLIKYFVMTCKNLPLDKISILDTPGFSSNDKEDSLRTIDVINECDALFWVVDANTGTVNQTSLETIKQYLKKPLYVIINKTDTKPQGELEQLKKQIEKDFARKNVSIEKILFYNDKGAHNAKIEDIVDVIKSVKQTNNSSKYIEHLLDFAEKVNDSCKNDTDSLENSMTNSRKEVQNSYENFINKLVSVQKDVQEACNIPHYEGHFWGSDKFEMSLEEGQRFARILERIHDTTTPEADKACRQTIEAEEIYCRDIAAYAEQKNILDRYEKLLSTLKNRIKRIR